ncbi:LacI family DNA-binding transcriptional regulator [Paenibacillus athensensis]|nr:LacI family DNA-binding transcriptional regulator [Paenibacillus athensensis]MCD1260404.1 LacI family DNA-binding transcriptional regulator [Paenibacillus athensensis]
MNIKQIAEKAGVSVATVSHVVNKTRFVSQELTERVLQVLGEMDGHGGTLLRNMKAVQAPTILVWMESVIDPFYGEVLQSIKKTAAKSGQQVVVLHTSGNAGLQEYIRLEKPIGLIVATESYREPEILKLKGFSLPTVIIGVGGIGAGGGHLIRDEYESAYKAAYHFIRSGHEGIGFVYAAAEGRADRAALSGFLGALRDHGLRADDPLILALGSEDDPANQVNKALDSQEEPLTAIICADKQATLAMWKWLKSSPYQCPDDISLLSLYAFEFSHMLSPPMTTVAHDPAELGRRSVEKLLGKIAGADGCEEDEAVASRIAVRTSTQCIGRGPLGERSASPNILQLSPLEIERIKSGSYSAAISFHYAGTAWARLHEKGIKDVFAEFGVKILAVTDAHFDPELQNKQHASILTMKPDVLISIPADEILTAPGYREVVQAGTKLVLINNVPAGFARDDFVTCVSINERENGQIAGRLLGEHLTRHGKKYVGLLVHGAPFFATRQRDTAAEQVLSEEFPELEIVASAAFLKESSVFDKCYELLKRYPQIEGLYVSWEGPTLDVLHVLRELKREDISVVTADLDLDVALHMARGGPVKGISAQRPYDQGRAVGMAAANALLGKSVPSFIGIIPYRITTDNLLTGWQDIVKQRAPAQLVHALKMG